MKLSDSKNNTVSGFISWNQDKIPIKFLDTLFKMPRSEFEFNGETIEFVRVK